MPQVQAAMQIELQGIDLDQGGHDPPEGLSRRGPNTAGHDCPVAVAPRLRQRVDAGL